ncbi:MAG: hypothetical protein ACRDE8_17260 [Ginsengibacter sp.]
MTRNGATNKSLLQIFISLLLLFGVSASCSKRDSNIDAATISDYGVTNAIASVGPAGPANKLVYYGNSDPDLSIACLGDYYLDISKGLLYGPKTANNWGSALGLKGASAAENKVYSGPENPASNFGITGDYYLNTSNAALYGPKIANGWGKPVNLQNPER